jgi:hypothetical protein
MDYTGINETTTKGITMKILTNDTEEALIKAEWALNNIQEHLKYIDHEELDSQNKWQIESIETNVQLVIKDVQEARALLKLPPHQRFIKKLFRK